jgi:hypothetical protein
MTVEHKWDDCTVKFVSVREAAIAVSEMECVCVRTLARC